MGFWTRFFGVLCVFFYTGVCWGADFVVPSGTTVNVTQTLSDVGDTGEVEEGGAISVAASVGVEMQNADQTVTNQGAIDTTGSSAHGVFNNGGANGTIDNSGTISTTGSDGFGIFINIGSGTINNSGLIETNNTNAFGIFINSSDDVTVNNSGTIRTSGAATPFGIFANFSDNVTITNSGTIDANGADALGILNESGANFVFTNTGTIQTTGASSYGLLNKNSAGSVLENSGTISTVGTTAYGIYISSSDDAILTNTGTISTSGLDATGVLSSGADTVVVNSGTISSDQGHALQFTAANPSLSLKKGSLIIGSVDTTSALDLSVESGMNVILTLTEASSGFDTLNIDGPYAQLGNTVAVINPIDFSLQADIVADIADVFLDGLGRPCCSSRNGYASDGHEFWLQGIGGYRYWRGDQSDYRYRQGGFLAGFDMLKETGAFRLFCGSLRGETLPKGESVSTHLRSGSYVGGVAFEEQMYKCSVGISMTAGYLGFDQNRVIAYNLSSNGLSGADDTRGGFFVAPEINFGTNLTHESFSPYLKVLLRYAGVFLNEYNETGVSAGLSLEKKSISFINPRIILGLPLNLIDSMGGWQTDSYVGIAGRFQLTGNTERGTLLEQPIEFSNGIQRNISSFLYGFKGCYNLPTMQLYFDLEGSYEFSRGQRFQGSGGLAINF